MDYFSEILTIFVFITGLVFSSATHSNEITYENLLKRNISTKVINAEEIIAKKGLGRFVTLSVVVNEEIIYCHYEKENINKLKLIMCY